MHIFFHLSSVSSTPPLTLRARGEREWILVNSTKMNWIEKNVTFHSIFIIENVIKMKIDNASKQASTHTSTNTPTTYICCSSNLVLKWKRMMCSVQCGTPYSVRVSWHRFQFASELFLRLFFDAYSGLIFDFPFMLASWETGLCMCAPMIMKSQPCPTHTYTFFTWMTGTKSECDKMMALLSMARQLTLDNI